MECDLNGFQSIRYVNGHGVWVQTLLDTIEVPVHLVVAMGIKGILNRWTASCYFDATCMPRLTANQREQAIGRLHAGQSAQVFANEFMPPSHQTSSQNVQPRPKKIVKRAVVGVERVT